MSGAKGLLAGASCASKGAPARLAISCTALAPLAATARSHHAYLDRQVDGVLRQVGLIVLGPGLVGQALAVPQALQGVGVEVSMGSVV